MNRARGFSLIEIVVVLAIIALSFAMVGPQISAGVGKLEMRNARATLQAVAGRARTEAKKSHGEAYIVFESPGSVFLLDESLKVIREERLPSAITFAFTAPQTESVRYVNSSGVVRGGPIALRGKSGVVQVDIE